MAVLAVFEVFFNMAWSANLQFTVEGFIASDDTAMCSIRFTPKLFDNGATFFYESQLTNAVALSINATPTNIFSSRYFS